MPDGVKYLSRDSISPLFDSSTKAFTDHHYYELCTHPSAITAAVENLVVELEQCRGETRLFACGDDNHCSTVLPTAGSWGYFSDESEFCTRDWSKPAFSAASRSCSAVPRASTPYLKLPQRSSVGNYFLMANGSGEFMLSVESTYRGQRMAPQLVFAGMHTKEAAAVATQKITGNSVQLKWHQSQVLLAGLGTPLFAAYMSYTAFVFDVKAMNEAVKRGDGELGPRGPVSGLNFRTMCGLAYAADTLTSAVVSVMPVLLSPSEEGADMMSHRVQGLRAGTRYRIVVVASCDGACLRQLSKTAPSALMSCSSSSSDCKTQNLVYEATEFSTKSKDDSSDDGQDDGDASEGGVVSLGGFVTIAIVVLVLALVLVLLSVAYSYKPHDRSLLSCLGFGGGPEETGSGIRGAQAPSSGRGGWLGIGRGSRSDVVDGTEMVESGLFRSAGGGLFGDGSGRGENKLKEMKRSHPSRLGGTGGVAAGYSRAVLDDRDDEDAGGLAAAGAASSAYSPPPLPVSGTTYAPLHAASTRSGGAAGNFVVSADDDDDDDDELHL